jgi:hypothetical protein
MIIICRVAIAFLLIAPCLAKDGFARDTPSGATLAFGKLRQWSDVSRKFKIKAKLASADKQTIQLEKEDGNMVAVPFEKLSEADQAFIESFLLASAASRTSVSQDDPENPFAGGSPVNKATPNSSMSKESDPFSKSPNLSKSLSPASKKEESEAGAVPRITMQGTPKLISLNFGGQPWNGSPAEEAVYTTREDAAWQLAIKKDFFDSAAFVVSGDTGWLSFDNVGRGRNNSKYGQLYSVNISNGDVQSIFESSDPWRLLAVSPSGSRLVSLLAHRPFLQGNQVAVFERDNQGTMRPKFQFTAGDGEWAECVWAGFLSDQRLVTLTQKHDLTIWNLETKSAIARGNTGGSQKIAISHQGDRIAIPSPKSIAILETSELKQIGCLEVDGTAIPSVAFSSDGQHLAALVPYAVQIFSLVDGSLQKSISIAEVNAQAGLAWVGKNVLINQRLLIDTSTGLPLWTYDLGNAVTCIQGNRLHAVFPSEQATATVSVSLPHAAVSGSLKQREVADLYVLGPGSTFRIQDDLAELTAAEKSEVRAAMIKKLTDKGWKEDEESANLVSLSLSQGEVVNIEYQESGFPFRLLPPPPFFGRSSGTTSKASARPWKHAIVFTVNDQEVYRTQTTIGPPQSLQCKEGETTQQAVDRLCEPSLNFFKGADFPKQIMNPKYRGGFGRSRISERGIQ